VPDVDDGGGNDYAGTRADHWRGRGGLQAIATARRLGAVASAYDMRPAAKEQVQSLGGRFVELAIEAKDAQDASGYAKAQMKASIKSSGNCWASGGRERRGNHGSSDPGKKSPVLVTKDMVERMRRDR